VRTFVLLIAIATAMPAAGCGAGLAEGDTARRAPDFALDDLGGRTVRLSDHAGKVILLNFWATWCVPCAAEMPHLQKLYEHYADRGLIVLAISMDGPESVADVAPRARQYRLSFPVLLDEETRVVGLYNPKRAAPFTVLIGRDGSVVSTREGYAPGDEAALEREIRSLLVVAAPR